jgi:circadian clock protein KaiC
VTAGDSSQIKSILIRLIDFLQKEQITVMFTALTNYKAKSPENEDISSLVDTWLSVREIESNGERNRGLYILKSRGMKNSNQVREFIITDNGIEIVEVTLGPDGVLVGSAREAYHLEKDTRDALRNNLLNRKNKEIESKKSILDAKIAKLKTEFELVKDELNRIYIEEELRNEVTEKNKKRLVKIRERKDGNIIKRKTK